MTRAADLAERYTIPELVAKIQAIEADPANHTARGPEGRPVGTIYLYTKAARRRIDALTWAITLKLIKQRAEAASRLALPGVVFTEEQKAQIQALNNRST